MSHQTHIERIAAREAAARARARGGSVADREDTAAPAGAAAPVDDAPRGAWTIGSIVAGRFVLQQRLGRGRYGPIYKALDRSLTESLIGVEHHVALQELHARIATQPILVERLEQLPWHPQAWSHPNIVKLLEFGRDGSKHFLCEELLEGASLRLVLEKSAPEPLAYTEVLGVLRSVGDALNYAHAKGVVHGDLRPENVFVTNAYTVKVLGLLPCSEPRPAPFFVEDADTGCEPHPSDDVYGLACLAYELLTGRHPYNGNSPIEALRAGLAAHPVPSLAPLRWQALSRGLALRRERRTASVAELLAGLGVSGTETLHPERDAEAKTAQSTQPIKATTSPEVAAPVDSAPRSGAARVSAPPTAARPKMEPPPPADWFDEPAFDHGPPTWTLHRPHGGGQSRPIRSAVGIMAGAAVAVFVYRDHAQLRVQAADLIESGATFASAEIAQWQQTAVAPKPGAARVSSPPTRPEESSAVASISAPQPHAAAPAPAPSTEDTPAPRPVAPEPVAPVTHEAPARAAAPAQRAARTAAAPAAAPRFEFAERTVTVRESAGIARIAIRRIGPTDAEAAVVWWTADRSALADEDYAVLGARIETFKAGEDTRVVYVPLIVDSMPERRESFVVNLRADRAGSATAAQLEVVIVDDDS